MAQISDYKFLTIIIPTYNRGVQLKKNIELTLLQVVNFKDLVRIYVSDNDSTDGTADMIKTYLEKYPDLVFYFCQEKNITASPNFNHAVHAVNSDYVYILGDDDYLFPFFLSNVLDLIKKNPNVGLFHFNYLMGLDNFNDTKLLYSKIEPTSYLKLYDSGKEFIFDKLNGPSFISSCLFKRTLWLEGAKLVKDDCPGYVWFSILLFGCMNYQCAYYQAPMLYQSLPSKNNYARNWLLYYVYGLGNLFEHLDKFVPGVYNRWICESQQNNVRHLLKIMSDAVYFRKFYSENKSLVEKHLKTKIVRLYFKVVLLPLPRFIAGKLLKNLVRLAKILEV